MFAVAFYAPADELLGPLVGTSLWFQRSQPCHGCLLPFFLITGISHCMYV